MAFIICNCGVLPFSSDTWALGFILIFNWAPRSGWTGDESDDVSDAPFVYNVEVWLQAIVNGPCTMLVLSH